MNHMKAACIEVQGASSRHADDTGDPDNSMITEINEGRRTSSCVDANARRSDTVPNSCGARMTDAGEAHSSGCQSILRDSGGRSDFNSICRVCSRKDGRKVTIKCVDCSSVYHASCVQLTPAAARATLTWRCSGCMSIPVPST